MDSSRAGASCVGVCAGSWRWLLLLVSSYAYSPAGTASAMAGALAVDSVLRRNHPTELTLPRDVVP